MNVLKDIIPIFKKHQITYKDKYRESGNIYTFIFETEKQITWKAGQHGIFTINHVKINKPTRPFSIASIPTEGHIKISMKISENPSEFKQVLLNLEKGTELSMRGPIGSFYIKNQKPRLFITGGIGITPFRALIKNLLINSAEMSDTQLLYIDSKEEFLYTEEFEEASKVSSLITKYFVKRENLHREIEEYATKHNNEAEYFIVGSKSMVDATETMLKRKGITKMNIKKDVFVGYKV